jgi:hypothetical protein
MFFKCSDLVNAPELPATELEPYCYLEMFLGCTSLVDAPALPATELKTQCYKGMFQGCTALENAPELLAPKLVSLCYWNLFKDCTNLKYIKAMFTEVSDENALTDWVENVAPEGKIIYNINIDSTLFMKIKIKPAGWKTVYANKYEQEY